MVLTVPAALLLLLCIACNNRANLPEKNKAVEASDRKDISDNAVGVSTFLAADSIAYKDEAPAPQQQVQFHGKKAGSGQAASPDWDKKIIKTADLNLEVKNFRTFAESGPEQARAQAAVMMVRARCRMVSPLCFSPRVGSPRSWLTLYPGRARAERARLMRRAHSIRD